jgi:hypothetical protein
VRVNWSGPSALGGSDPLTFDFVSLGFNVSRVTQQRVAVFIQQHNFPEISHQFGHRPLLASGLQGPFLSFIT